MGFEVRALDGSFGREIVGLDISAAIAPDVAVALKQVWLDHGDRKSVV